MQGLLDNRELEDLEDQEKMDIRGPLERLVYWEDQEIEVSWDYPDPKDTKDCKDPSGCPVEKGNVV